MYRFDVEIQNDSPYDYGMGTTLMGVLKDDMGERRERICGWL